MTVVTSKKTKEQMTALAEWHELKAAFNVSGLALAKGYKKALEVGLDMSAEVSQDTGQRLLALAEGKLYDVDFTRLSVLPRSGFQALLALSKNDQKIVWSEGVSVWRRSGAETVPYLDLADSEYKRIVDATGGLGRLLDPEEQKNRITGLTIHAPKRDQIVEVRLTYEENVEALAAARKAGLALGPYLISLIHRDTGVPPPKRRGALKRPAASA